MFYRMILGLPQSAPVSGLHLELGRLKLTELASIRSISFWLRLTDTCEDRLLKTALKVQVDMASKGTNCWATKVKYSLDKLGLSNAWNQPPPKEKHSIFLRQVRKVMADQSFARCLEDSKSLKSLKNYDANKLTFGCEDYVKFGLEKRRAVAIFRLNCTRSLAVKHQANTKECELCGATIRDVWCHMLYFCSNVQSDILELPKEKIFDHIFHYQRHISEYTERIINIMKAKAKESVQNNSSTVMH